MLVDNSIRLKDPKAVADRGDVTYQLSTLARQQPNGNFLFLFPREYFYLDNNKPRDTTRIDRFLRTTLGQPPAVYRDSLSRLATRDMQAYLQRLGYFNAVVYHEADRRRRRKVNLIYHVDAGRRYLIDSLEYSSTNPTLDSLLQDLRPGSELRSGEPLDLNAFDREKARLARELRNRGFAYFSGAYFDELEIDTFRRRGYADVFLSLLPPQKENAYERYRVGEVTVYTDYSPLPEADGARRDTTVRGVRFVGDAAGFRVRPGVLRESIYLRRGAFHSREDLEKTNLSLNGLGLYRFVRISQQINADDPNVIDYQIQLTPSNKMSLGADLDFNYTNRNSGIGANNLLGLSVTPSFRNRNVLGGAELLVTSLRAGVEVVPSIGDNAEQPFFNTVDLGANASLFLPRFKDLGLYRLLNRVPSPFGGRVLPNAFLSQLRERASTRYSVGYEYLLIRDFYAYTLLNASLGYDFKRSLTTNYRITHLAVDVLNPTVEPQFEAILETNEFLRRSIGEQYFFSLLFRNLEYTREGRPDRRGRSLALRGQVEVAGAEVSLINDLYNALADIPRTFKPNDDATFARYTTASADVRYLKKYTGSNAFAARFLIAAGRSFGAANEEVPYVKQFFAGGANSVRAWQPRALGPGGYVDPISLADTVSDRNLRLFQTGNFRLELNAEYRFPIAGFFKGAVFADLGNVWTLREDPDRPGSQFLLRKRPNADGTFVHQPFWRQLALGVGSGVRVDLSYFIFRFDVALPVRYNYPQTGRGDQAVRDGSPIPESAYWRRFNSIGLSDFTFQLGLGYPF